MKEFNWKEYLNLRPDLKKNWNSPIKARAHWILFGFREDRGKVYLVNFFSPALRGFFLQGSARKSALSKVGIVITYHNNASRFTVPCLDSVLEHTPEPRFILAFDNESTEKESKDLPAFYKEKDIRFIRIDDQTKNGGLTGTWNQGIDLCIKNNCDKIILLNYDTVVDESWKIFIKKIVNNNVCYGPASNKPGWNKAGQNRTKEYSLKNKDSVKIGSIINGFCMGFTKKALVANKYNLENYFNSQFSFGGNEFEWQDRFRKKKGKSLVVEGCFVYHHGLCGWKDRVFIINQMLKDSKDKTYLEIGIGDGYSLKHVSAKTRIGVDLDMSCLNPEYISNKFFFFENKLCGEIIAKLKGFFFKASRQVYLYEMTSDEFFEKDRLKQQRLDVVLIDGFVQDESIRRDIENCLNRLNDGGVIVVRGCNPLSRDEVLVDVPSISGEGEDKVEGGMGNKHDNVWKIITYMRATRDDLNIFTLDIDSGLAIITKGKPDNMLSYSAEEVDKMDFDDLDENRVKFLNLKKEGWFLEFLKSRNY